MYVASTVPKNRQFFLCLWIILNVLHNHTFKFVPFGISKAARSAAARSHVSRSLVPKSRRLQHTFTFIGRLKSTHNTHTRSHIRLIMIDYWYSCARRRHIANTSNIRTSITEKVFQFIIVNGGIPSATNQIDCQDICNLNIGNIKIHTARWLPFKSSHKRINLKIACVILKPSQQINVLMKCHSDWTHQRSVRSCAPLHLGPSSLSGPHNLHLAASPAACAAQLFWKNYSHCIHFATTHAILRARQRRLGRSELNWWCSLIDWNW